ncbi:MAG: MgtC/SapB family protein, partial [Bacilli bacterium]|nr:MgtC/SapB family protein [Bacilli bacterium]
DIWEVLLRLGLTALFVGIIGVERQLRQKTAGVTTHLMVAFGAAGIAILQDAMYYDAIETAKALFDAGYTSIAVQIQRQRVIAQVVTGVGFLGAGTILKTRNGIYGLTTAATLWLSSMIGLAFGMGAYWVGIIIALFSLIFLTLFRKVLSKTALHHVDSPDIIGTEHVDD